MSWKSLFFTVFFLLAGVAVLVVLTLRGPAPPAHRVYVNGSVLVMDEANTVAQALSTRGERIDEVGSTKQIMALVTDDTEVVDLQGRTLLPGFIDAHGHFPGSGLRVLSADLNSPPIGDKKEMADVLAAISAQAAETEPGDWVAGFGYDDTLLAEKRHPTRAELDAISTDHPIALLHVSGH
ncbi:amidohydrolase family protein, partial [Halioglobus sp.]|nr:amidohydrolase family protein [Halioglobus sp.]